MGAFSFAAILSLGLASAVAGGTEPRIQPAPVAYHEVGEESQATVQALKKAYAGVARVVNVSEKDGFVASHLKGPLPYPADPRPDRERGSPCKVVFSYIVTARGIVRDTRILQSDNKVAAEYCLRLIGIRWFVPAHLHGQPVASVILDELALEPSKAPGSVSDGMGFQGYRDR